MVCVCRERDRGDSIRMSHYSVMLRTADRSARHAMGLAASSGEPVARCHGGLLRRASSPDARAEMPHPLWTRHLGEAGGGEAGFGTPDLVQPVRFSGRP